MFVKYYNIAYKKVKIVTDSDIPISLFSGFEADEADDEYDILIELYSERKLFNECYGIEYLSSEYENNYLFASKISPLIRMMANKNFDRIIIENCKISIEGVTELILVGFYTYIVKYGGILVHASLIKYKDEGVIFAADSGVGKTTQAVLWEKYMNAEIINGDKVILECDKDGKVYAWGSPWKGSSPYNKNETTPLKAIVILEQSKENAIKGIYGTESLSLCLPHIFYPYWNEFCVNELMKNIDLCIKNVHIYHLCCRPDEEAVQLTKERIWNSGND